VVVVVVVIVETCFLYLSPHHVLDHSEKKAVAPMQEAKDTSNIYR